MAIGCYVSDRGRGIPWTSESGFHPPFSIIAGTHNCAHLDIGSLRGGLCSSLNAYTIGFSLEQRVNRCG